jgi:pyridoxal phosphate enzyme (YggS family)
MDIAENIKRIREAIGEAAIQSGRAPGDITLVAAAKTHPAGMVKEAIASGVDAVGENRVQEMLEKHAQGAYHGAPLHFIGHLQSNKVGKVVGLCDLIESVSSKALLEMIGKKAVSLGVTQNVLIEVNIGAEPAKSGVATEKIWEILESATETSGINVLGLMAIPPFFDKSEKVCYYFDTMYKLFIDIRGKKYDNVSMRFLSMGMSDSFIDAIRAGANMVRIGSAIFGSR